MSTFLKTSVFIYIYIYITSTPFLQSATLELTQKKNGRRRGERYCYLFFRRKRLNRDFAKAASAKRKFKKNRPSFLVQLELTVHQGNPYHTEYSLRIIYNTGRKNGFA